MPEVRMHEYDVCDFCSSPDPQWLYRAKNQMLTPPGEPMPMKSQGDWLACDQCAACVQNNEWGKLARRALEAPTVKAMLESGAMPEEVILREANRSVKTFRLARTDRAVARFGGTKGARQ